MDGRLFWKALAVQGAVLAESFAILAATADSSFFEDYGWVTGSAVSLLASTGDRSSAAIPLRYVVPCAAAGGAAGALVFLAGSHTSGYLPGCGWSLDPRMLWAPPPWCNG